MNVSRLFLLPAFLVSWSSCTFLVSYLVAVLRGDVDVVFPYISDTGALPPESCIFGLMTFISACAGIATIYSRFKYVDKLNQELRVVGRGLNTAACVLGMISILGMCVVATFQETSVKVVHLLGAGVFFVAGVVYVLLQSVISFQSHPLGSSLTMCRVRAGIACVALLTMVPTIICGNLDKQAEIHTHPEDKGYSLHLCATVCEWVVTFSFISFFLTYIDDFKLFTLHVTIQIDDDDDDDDPQQQQVYSALPDINSL